jgi:RND superfamily putative drug exporter
MEGMPWRSAVALLYLLAASGLGLGAALGLTVYVFQGLLGHGELTYYVPFVASVLLLSLGSDYNIFLAGRVWDEARRRPIREAVVVGGSRAASAITVAGIVLALSFALLALVPLRPFRELAFAMTAGLLLDAFVVRTLLVPALMALAGPWSAWPRRFPPALTRPAVAGAEPAATSPERRPGRALILLAVALLYTWPRLRRRR